MNKKFLNRVIKQVTSETRMDFTRGRVYTPFLVSPLRPSLSHTFYLSSFLLSPFLSSLFSEHCENVYGLNNKEIDYTWEEYKDIIDNKIIKEGAGGDSEIRSVK